MRKRYDKEFKAKVALGSPQGRENFSGISDYLRGPSEYDCPLEEAVRQKDELYKQIGQLQVENDYLKKYKQLYGTEPKW